MKKIILLCLVFCVVLSICVSGISSEGLVLYHNYTNDAGDSSGIGNDGTVEGPIQVVGRIDNGYNFTEIEDNITVSDDDSLEIQTGNFTIAFWAKRDDAHSANLVLTRKFVSSVVPYQVYFDAFGRLTLRQYEGGWTQWVSSQYTYVDKWYYYAITYNGTNVTMYVNGTQTDELNNLSTKITNAGDLIIGSYPLSSNWFNGTLDEIAIYNRSLESTEIEELYKERIGWQYPFESNAYYVGNVGDDENDGLTESTAFLTLSKLNSVNFLSGDEWKLNRTSMWRSPEDAYLLPQSNVDISSYGIGNQPEIWGSINASLSTDWVEIISNIWNYTSNITVDVGNILFNDASTYGNKSDNKSQLIKQGDFAINSTDGNLYLYSVGNPTTIYDNIELAMNRGNGAEVVGLLTMSYNRQIDNVKFENITLRNYGANGIYGNRVSNIEIVNCSFYDIGGGYQDGEGLSMTRFGNSIEFWCQNRDVKISNSYFNGHYDEAITNQGSGVTCDITNMNYSYNIFEDTHLGIKIWVQGASMSNITIDHNTGYNTGGELWYEQRPDKRGEMIGLGDSTGATVINNITITNNIMYNSTEDILRISSNYNDTNTSINHNLYFSPEGLTIIDYKGTGYNLTGFQGATTFDVNSTQSNPLFTDATNGDFTPQIISPACTLSPIGSYVGALPCASAETQPPTYALFQNNASPTLSGTGSIVQFTFNLSDETQLNTYTFAHNQSGNLTNTSTIDITGTNHLGTFNLTITSPGGSHICGQVSSFNDTSGNTNSTNLSCFTVESTVPVISSIVESDITTTQITISWTTNEVANTTVNYGVTSGSPDSVSQLNDATLSHSRTLTALTSNSEYFYTVTSCDPSGNCATSAEGSFTINSSQLTTVNAFITGFIVIASFYSILTLLIIVKMVMILIKKERDWLRSFNELIPALTILLGNAVFIIFVIIILGVMRTL